ncbi:11028_t:CDS:2 [Funneliformis geosporum]|uniref:Large ribosomal subunit protein uL5m n=1 Tax=Funneliformis geosporum TaxID=1117311 RepID=A0A9W4SH49_9GLOM|nr:7098_t:CDS:2 [Funneliformis geosporum]CAI2168747.1 11028_t:CDS:2 [Funneliformis geosporum]
MLLSTKVDILKKPLIKTTRVLTSRHLQTFGKFKPSANLIDDSEFYPGKSSMIRMEEYYNTILYDDLMILTYKDPKSEKTFIEKRLKKHLPLTKVTRDTDNPFLKNRPPLKPRGDKKSKPIPPPQTHESVPYLKEIYVHCMIKQAIHNKQHLLSGIMALQCITSERPTVTYSKTGVANWKLRAGMPIGCKVCIQGPPMYTFIDKLVEIVLPRMKEWHGVPMSSGDGDGNIAMGFPASALSLFPDIEGNYDSFPLMTGFDVIFNTTAYTDFEARSLLSGFQIPFNERKRRNKL